MRVLRWLAALVAVCALAACGPKAAPNVFLIVIDTLRADRVGWYGDERRLTPFLDSLAGRGTVFWNAYAQTSWTSPSVATILTSRYASQHNVIHFGSVLAPQEQTLAESLQQRGYLTAGFSGNAGVSPRFGFAQGFNQFLVFPPEHQTADAKGRAEELNAAGLAWVERTRREHPGIPLFVYLHYMEPHVPYNPPSAVLDRLLRTRPRPEERRQGVARAQAAIKEMWTGGLNRLTADGVTGLQDLYDAEIMSLDLQLADLFRQLREQGLLTNALIVITADHGDEFREHGRIGHGATLYNEVTHVPLLLLTPHSYWRADVRDTVSLVDIAPTLLDYLGVAVPGTFEGRSLRGLVRRHHGLWRVLRPLQGLVAPPQDAAEPSFSELFPIVGIPSEPARHQRAVIVGDRKLIVHADNGEESFDLATNPHESPATPLTGADVSTLRARLDRFSMQLAHGRVPEQVRPLDPGTRERLRALGYAE